MNGLINSSAKVKIPANGELKTKVTVKVNAISEKAKQAIESAGGSVELV
jgi:large subunit ribosomal protein L15